jgi:aminoglycoside phosphotransferase family enzyme/predicted kinase
MECRQLIEVLSDPAAYPGPVDVVEVRQTHISVVFLAGSYAYKIKKPVDLGFVDYSTLERRCHFCTKEVRLNLRLAPEVYLGVVPVTRDAGAIRMEGTGEVVEWAVKMTRLPDDATLRAILRRGELGPEVLASLAHRLAEFHAGADRGARIASCASFASVIRNQLENLDQAAPQVGVTLSQPVLDRLRSRSLTTLDALHGLIDDRTARGVPRDTHGDLRLEHVYWFPDRKPSGEWVIVDCVEFDERFRYADPIADISFLAMELAIKGQRRLASAFTDAYLDATGDKDGRSLLPFFMAYRSMVRGKVRGLKSADPQIPEPARAEARDLACAHWLFALSELEAPSQRPGLVLVAGLPGTGKSSLAGALAERAGFTVIRSDEVRKGLADRTSRGSSPPAFGQDIYTEDWNKQTYAKCLRSAQDLLFEGKRVLIDASFREESRRRLFLDTARRWGIPGCLLVCHASPDVVRRRLEGRHGDVSDADWSVHAEIARRWQELSPRTRMVTREVDTSGSRTDAIRKGLEALQDFGLAAE